MMDDMHARHAIMGRKIKKAGNSNISKGGEATNSKISKRRRPTPKNEEKMSMRLQTDTMLVLSAKNGSKNWDTIENLGKEGKKNSKIQKMGNIWEKMTLFLKSSECVQLFPNVSISPVGRAAWDVESN